MQMHVGAVEQRVALADHRNRASGFEMRGNLGGGLIIEIPDRIAIAGAAFRQFGRHRIKQRQFDDAGAQMRARQSTREWLAFPALAKCAIDVRLGKRARRLQRHQLRIARPDADAQQLPGARRRAHMPGPRQRIDRSGSHGAAAHASAHDEERHAARIGGKRLLGFGGADEADRDAEDRRRLRRTCVDQIEQTEQRGRAHCRWRQPPPRYARATSRALPPNAWWSVFAARSATRGSLSVQITSLSRRQARASDPARHHLGVAEDRRAGRERAARGGDKTVAEHDILRAPRPRRRHGSCAPRPRLRPARSVTDRPRRG